MNLLLPARMPRLFQAKWQKLEGEHAQMAADKGKGIPRFLRFSHAKLHSKQQIPGLLDSPADSARARVPS
jgi:hypothetical protein